MAADRIDSERVRFVVGFFFDDAAERVVLVRKNRPSWQCGKLNAPGGRVEEGETPTVAMVREFEEETGMRVESWREFCVLQQGEAEVTFFCARGDVRECRTATDEILHVVSSDLVGLEVVYNLRWLVPMALDASIDGAVVVAK